MNHIEKFREVLSKPIILHRKKMENVAEEIAKSIFASEPKSRGRSYKEILHTVSKGMVNEIAIAEVLGERNPAGWNHRDINTYGWDVLDKTHNLRIEVKSHTGIWWGMELKYISTLVKSIQAKVVDVIVTAEHTTDKIENFIITPKLIINPQTFSNYILKSNFSGYYYNHKMAVSDSQCILL